MSKKHQMIGLGTAQFGMNYGVANTSGRTPDNEAFEILDYAKKLKINTLDTAKAYGESEDVLGKYFLNANEKGWNVVTKVSSNYGNVVNQIEQSYKKITKYPNAVLAHSKKDYLNEEFFHQLISLKEKKNIKMIGVSIYDYKDIEETLSFHKPDIIQIPLNILDTRLFWDGTLNDLISNDIIIHIRSVFLQGLFYLSERQIKKKFPDVFNPMNQLKIIANKAGITISELSLLWVSSLNFNGKIIIGVDSLDQLKKHERTLSTSVKKEIFEEALSIKYKNINILNPSLWKTK